jgi:hypothetical protein
MPTRTHKVCDVGDIGVLEIAQLVGVVATVGALVFTAVELRASANERKRLERRLRHERLEDLAIRRLDAVDVERDLSEVRARIVALSQTAYPEAWKFTEAEVSAEEGLRFEDRNELTKLASAAQVEVHAALTESATSLSE